MVVQLKERVKCERHSDGTDLCRSAKLLHLEMSIETVKGISLSKASVRAPVALIKQR